MRLHLLHLIDPKPPNPATDPGLARQAHSASTTQRTALYWATSSFYPARELLLFLVDHDDSLVGSVEGSVEDEVHGPLRGGQRQKTMAMEADSTAGVGPGAASARLPNRPTLLWAVARASMSLADWETADEALAEHASAPLVD